MVIELGKSDFEVEVEKQLQVYYDSQVVGDFFVDLFIEQEVIVELKSVEKIAPVHKEQLLTYLRLAAKRLGLLINYCRFSLRLCDFA